MRPVAAWLIYLGVVLVGGGLLAPWVYWAAQAAAAHASVLEPLAGQPFHRYVHRCMLVLALAGIFPLVRSLGFSRWVDLGLPPPRGELRPLRRGFLAGLCSLAFVAVAVLLAGARQLDVGHPWSEGIPRLGQALLTAAVVGVLEELLFRGTLFGALRRALSWKSALVWSSFIYALVHFFQKPAPPPTIDVLTGLNVLGQMLQGFGQLDQLAPKFVTLFLAGAILGLGYQKTGNLYFSIGLHAGWIFWLRAFSMLTHGQPSAANRWLWGDGKVFDGWLSTVVLGLVLVWVWTRADRPSAMPDRANAIEPRTAL